jgi:hypothetical protein
MLETTGDKGRKIMKKNQSMVGLAILAVALFTSFFFAGGAQAQALTPAYKGEFTLTHQTHWGNSVLKPGTYTITIKSVGQPVIALIRNSQGDAVTYVVSGANGGNAIGVNALLIKQKDGELFVHSLALADVGMVLIYNPSLTREKVHEVRFSQTVPVRWAKN